LPHGNATLNKKARICLMMCKTWYLISRTVSEYDAHRDRSVGDVAVKPRALGAPLCGIGA
jgi:hypothetical protein